MINKSHFIQWSNSSGSRMECRVEMSDDSAKVTSVNEISGEEPKQERPRRVVPDKECSGCTLSRLKRMVTGSVKLLKSELGIDGTNTDELESRKRICLGCDKYDFGVCTDCGCFLSAKIKLKAEECPQGKW